MSVGRPHPPAGDKPFTLFIAGASVRAALQSASRGGICARGADLFADVDTQATAATIRVRDYPHGLFRALREQPVDGWMYTGALENHTQLIDRMRAACPLLGNSGEQLSVRDPQQLGEVLHDAGLPMPEMTSDGCRVPTDGNWLCKPRASAGGCGIQRFTCQVNRPRPFYFQRYVAGTPQAGLFLAARGKCVLLGVTQQLVGQPWTENEFQYAGSLGPIPLSDVAERQWRRLGAVLTAAFQLSGLFGVDAVWTDDRLVPLEVNPRYPASAEIIETATKRSLVAAHLSACLRGELPEWWPTPHGSKWFAKAILYSKHRAVVTEGFSAFVAEVNRTGHDQDPSGHWPTPRAPFHSKLADIPATGESIDRGHPVITGISRGSSRPEALARVRHVLHAAQNELACCESAAPEERA